MTSYVAFLEIQRGQPTGLGQVAECVREWKDSGDARQDRGRRKDRYAPAQIVKMARTTRLSSLANPWEGSRTALA